jgi:ABC-type branched-subunit amino acid transport system substrate-binding protein
MKKLSLFFLAVILTLAACGPTAYTCTDPLGCVEIPSGDPIVIGTLLATTGPSGPTGTASQEAVEKAIADRGPLFSHPLDLDRSGTDCTADSARTAATGLALNPDLVAVIGPTCPEEIAIITPILSDAGIALLSPAPDAASIQTLIDRLFSAIEQVAVQDSDGTLHIPRQALNQILEKDIH